MSNWFYGDPVIAAWMNALNKNCLNSKYQTKLWAPNSEPCKGGISLRSSLNSKIWTPNSELRTQNTQTLQLVNHRGKAAFYIICYASQHFVFNGHPRGRGINSYNLNLSPACFRHNNITWKHCTDLALMNQSLVSKFRIACAKNGIFSDTKIEFFLNLSWTSILVKMQKLCSLSAMVPFSMAALKSDLIVLLI